MGALARPAQRTALAALRSPWPWLLALLMLAAGALAYQAPYRATIKVGGHPSSGADCYASGVFDWPYLDGFNQDPELYAPPQRCADATIAFRWAFDAAAIQVPGIGSAPREFRLGVVSGQPERPVVLSDWSSGGDALLTVPVRHEPRVYNVLLPPSEGLDVAFRTPGYQGPNDPRELAFAVDSARAEPLARTAPAWTTLMPLALLVAVAYVGLRRAGVDERWAIGAGVALVGALAALLAWERTALTLLTARQLWLAPAAVALLLALAPLAGGLARRLGIAPAAYETRSIAALIALAWLLRCLGLLHPQAYSSDLGLNVNNLRGVIGGQIVFGENLPSEAGGGMAPYPPAQYVMLAPLTLLSMEDRALVIVANALLDSLVIVALWLVLRGAGFELAAAVFAAALYLVAAPLLRSLSVGEMANVWGQALATFAIATLALWRDRRLGSLVLACAIAVALLGHFGILLSLLAFLATYGALLLGGRRDRARFALVVLTAGAAAFALYYSAQLDTILALPDAPAPTNSALRRLGYEWAELWRPGALIGPLATVLGLAGLVLAWRRSRDLGLLLAAWWVSVLLSWVTLLWSQQALRWEAFLYPAVALGGGIALEALWRRAGAARVLACALVAVALTLGVLQWVEQIATYGH